MGGVLSKSLRSSKIFNLMWSTWYPEIDFNFFISLQESKVDSDKK